MIVPPRGPTPEELARVEIDRQLEGSGWVIQDRDEINLSAGQGVAIREFKLKAKHGFADYLLFIDGQANRSRDELGPIGAGLVHCEDHGDDVS